MITVKNATYDKCKKHPLTTKSSTDYCCSTHIYDDKNMTIKLNMGKLNLAHSISLIGISLNIDVAFYLLSHIWTKSHHRTYNEWFVKIYGQKLDRGEIIWDIQMSALMMPQVWQNM